MPSACPLDGPADGSLDPVTPPPKRVLRSATPISLVEELELNPVQTPSKVAPLLMATPPKLPLLGGGAPCANEEADTPAAALRLCMRLAESKHADVKETEVAGAGAGRREQREQRAQGNAAAAPSPMGGRRAKNGAP